MPQRLVVLAERYERQALSETCRQSCPIMYIFWKGKE